MNTSHLYHFFDTDFPLNQEGLKELIESFSESNYKKGESLLQENTIDTKLRFLNSGVVREFYASEVKETNINFYTKPQFITDFSSFKNTIITRKNQECLTEVQVLTINKERFEELLNKYPCGKSFINATFQKLLEEKEEFEYIRLTKQPDEMYQLLLENSPECLQMVPQYHIASFLGVTPETLSRIRKKMSLK
ncbi:Crp/Fnr family transcriptional regulator [Marinifilum breve]|uniref:Crp/Fnr family transcriptional regulator n=1 Tax=Marinifilum breve TaxID=2184082 RepID=A0A2V4A2Q7_9BACT|nr:Crp/Fnr family transcriptional regulator [Marinifilum breve]PXY02623.1 Crp/Fnr family transcriptional regulator [Marinifilum breve]